MNDRYALVTDFVYLTVLADGPRAVLPRGPWATSSSTSASASRVRESAAILKPLLLEFSYRDHRCNATVPEALKAIAWIAGEYAHFITDHSEVIAAPASQRGEPSPHVQWCMCRVF